MEHPIKTWRDLANKSQRELARDLGVSRWTVSQIENGERMPSPSLVRKITIKTGISRDKLRPDIYA